MFKSFPLLSALCSLALATFTLGSPIENPLKTRGDAPCPSNWRFDIIYINNKFSFGYTATLKSDQGDNFAESSSVNVSGKFGSAGKWLYPGTAEVTPRGSADVYKFEHTNYGFNPQDVNMSNGQPFSWTVQGCETPMTCTVKTDTITYLDPETNEIRNFTVSSCVSGTDPGTPQTMEASQNQAYVITGYCAGTENSLCDSPVQQDTGVITVDRT